MMSTMLASVGGALYAGLIGYIDPFPFTIHESILIVRSLSSEDLAISSDP